MYAMTPITLTVGGMHTTGLVTPTEVTHKFTPYGRGGGGLHLVRFELYTPLRSGRVGIPWLTQGALVQVRAGTISLGWAAVSDINLSTGEVVADGLYRRAEHFPAISSSIVGGEEVEVVTTNPRAAVVYGNAHGLGWGDPAGLPDEMLPPTVEDTSSITTLAALLDEWAKLEGKAWGLDADNKPYLVDVPASVGAYLRPGTPAMETAEDDYANHIALRYATAVTTPTSGEPVPTGWDIVVAHSSDAPHGDRWYFEDISDLGLLDPDPATALMIAQSLADLMLTQRSARWAFTQGVAVDPWQVTDAGGSSPSAWVPLAGLRVRQYGVLDRRATPNLFGTLEWTVGQCTYRPVEGTRDLMPTELVERSFSVLSRVLAS